jgi:hypothetical protein
MANYSMGSIAFILGLLISVVAGLMGGANNLYVPLLTAIIAIVVAIMNIDFKETMNVLLWTIATGVLGVGSLTAAFTGTFAIIGTILTAVGAYFTMIAVMFLIVVGWNMFKN